MPERKPERPGSNPNNLADCLIERLKMVRSLAVGYRRRRSRVLNGVSNDVRYNKTVFARKPFVNKFTRLAFVSSLDIVQMNVRPQMSSKKKIVATVFLH